jgi:hypothetical protein
MAILHIYHFLRVNLRICAIIAVTHALKISYTHTTQVYRHATERRINVNMVRAPHPPEDVHKIEVGPQAHNVAITMPVPAKSVHLSGGNTSGVDDNWWSETDSINDEEEEDALQVCILSFQFCAGQSEHHARISYAESEVYDTREP